MKWSKFFDVLKMFESVGFVLMYFCIVGVICANIGFCVASFIYEHILNMFFYIFWKCPEVWTIFVRTIFLWFLWFWKILGVLFGPPPTHPPTHPQRQCQSSLPGENIWKIIVFWWFLWKRWKNSTGNKLTYLSTQISAKLLYKWPWDDKAELNCMAHKIWTHPNKQLTTIKHQMYKQDLAIFDTKFEPSTSKHFWIMVRHYQAYPSPFLFLPVYIIYFFKRQIFHGIQTRSAL